jgi:hypothetical protein
VKFWWPKKKQGHSLVGPSAPGAKVAENLAIRQPKAARNSRLVLFIHGWRGADNESTWAKFPDLIRSDTKLSREFDVALFGYASAATKAGRSTSVPQAAQHLRTRIDCEWRDYAEITVIAHSQGGLVFRRYLADQLRDRRPQPVRRVLYFATPHLGALGPKLGGLLPGVSVETIDLAYDSDMLQSLFIDEAATDAHLAVHTKYVVAVEDTIVGRTSAWGMQGPGDYVLVAGENHQSIVKPASADHVSFIIARNFLLDTNAWPPVSASAVHEQPLLRTKQWQQTPKDKEKNRFLFWNRTIPFFGRDNEAQALATFLGDAERPFSWTLLTGSGGMGKSRLALELILAQQAGWWYAGFLDGFKTEDYWKVWQPRLPTLLVIDYAARTPDRVANILTGLSERQPPHLLRRPVRVLLIERDRNDSRLESIFAASPLLSGETTHASDLALRPIDDIWPLFQHVLTEAGVAPSSLDKVPMLASFDVIDKERRPLFAFLVADALAHGQNIRNWDRRALLDDVINRDRRRFWLPAAESVGLGAEIKKEERVLALATIAGGVSIEYLRAVNEDLLPKWQHDRHAPLFRAMTGRPAHTTVAPLQPDIVGEFFALQILADHFAKASNGATCAQSLLAASWQLDPLSTAQFLDRCRQDFFDLSTLSQLLEVKPIDESGRLLWCKVAFNLIAAHLENESTFRGAHKLYGELEALASAHSDNVEIRDLRAQAAGYLIRAFASHESRRDRALELYDELKDLATAYSSGREIIECQARAALDLIVAVGGDESNRARAFEFYSHLRGLAVSHLSGNKIREYQAAGALLLIVALQQDKNGRERACELYEELKELAARSNEANTLKYRATAAVSLIANYWSDESYRKRALELYDEFKTFASAHLTEPKIRIEHAKATLHLMYGHGRDESARGRAFELYDELKALAATHGNGGETLELLAETALNLIIDLGMDESSCGRAFELYGELKVLADAHPDISKIREHQAEVIVNLTYDLGGVENARQRILEIYRELKELTGAHSSESALREARAKAAVNLVYHFGNEARERDRAFRLLDELKTIVSAYPSEREICECVSAAIVNLIFALSDDESTRGRAFDLYGELKAFAADHSGDGKIREHQKLGALNLLAREQSSSERAHELRDELQALGAGGLIASIGVKIAATYFSPKCRRARPGC